MIQCTACDRHHRMSESACPFCQRPSFARRSLHTLGGVVTTLVLSACYGPPPGDYKGETADTNDTGLVDADADGYTSDVDCDDADAAINPGAEEVCDDVKDNDCDLLIDADDVDDCP
ncbi:MAG: hypothetical protein ACI8PZ_003651 [Myxococcota bacterium]|jgi:hypothetical protein